MKILWLKTELLHPVDKGGKIRTYHMLKELKRHHHITYLTLDDGTADPDALEKAEEYAHEVITVPHRVAPKFGVRFYWELIANLFSPLPYFMQKYRSDKMESAIRAAIDTGNHDILVCDFLMPSINVPDACDIPALIFQHNVESMIWKRHYEVADGPFRRAYFAEQWKRTLKYERETCRKFDSVVAVSEEDSDFFRTEFQVASVNCIPTGVDLEYFARRSDVGPGRHNVVFTGSMDWLPNEDAIGWFIAEILPIIRQTLPDVSVSIVGRNPSEMIVRRAGDDANLDVTGRVDDVRPYLEKADVFVVPIRIGGGTRLKIYEAMAMRLPVVSTTIGAEGLPVSDGSDIFLRDSAEEFANGVIELLTEKEKAAMMGKAGYERVRKDFGWANVAQEFSKLCEVSVRRLGSVREYHLATPAAIGSSKSTI